jgi:hypothetical protein
LTQEPRAEPMPGSGTVGHQQELFPLVLLRISSRKLSCLHTLSATNQKRSAKTAQINRTNSRHVEVDFETAEVQARRDSLTIRAKGSRIWCHECERANKPLETRTSMLGSRRPRPQ